MNKQTSQSCPSDMSEAKASADHENRRPPLPEAGELARGLESILHNRNTGNSSRWNKMLSAWTSKNAATILTALSAQQTPASAPVVAGDALREARDALRAHAVHREFDFPGDSPVDCGLWCNLCEKHVEDDHSDHKCVIARLDAALQSPTVEAATGGFAGLADQVREDAAAICDAYVTPWGRAGSAPDACEGAARKCAERIRAMPLPAAPAPDAGWQEGVADKIVLDVGELPDRTSPEDWPDAMLVTGEELRAIVLGALPPAPAQEGK